MQIATPCYKISESYLSDSNNQNVPQSLFDYTINLKILKNILVALEKSDNICKFIENLEDLLYEDNLNCYDDNKYQCLRILNLDKDIWIGIQENDDECISLLPGMNLVESAKYFNAKEEDFKNNKENYINQYRQIIDLNNEEISNEMKQLNLNDQMKQLNLNDQMNDQNLK